MRRQSLRSLVSISILTLGLQGAGAATYFVRAQGSDRQDGLTPKTAFATVLRAARLLNSGDRLVIGPGTYPSAILVAERFGSPDAPLAFIGDESGRETGDPAGPVVLTAATPGEPALRIHRAHEVLVSGLTIRGRGEGISLEKVRRVRLERCTFDGLPKAVNLDTCEDVRLESAVIARGVLGILVKNTARARLAHLTVASCSAAGLVLSSSSQGEIRNCLFVDNATAMVADNASTPTWSSDYNTLSGTLGSWGLTPLCRIAYEWFAATGQERHSSYVVPAFVGPAAYDLHIDPAVTWGGGLPGQYAGLELEPPVKADREGRPFGTRDGRTGCGAYAYPEPKPAAGWQKLAASLPAGAVRQNAALYAADGTLVRTLVSDAGGVRELWWDGRDDTGAALPPGDYELRAAAHDVQVLDDGTLGDNGNPMGTYNCDNAQRLVAYPDGSFVLSTVYDEAGIPLRFCSASGQPLNGSALADKNIWAIAATGKGKALVAGVDRNLQHIVPPGERAKMPSGAPAYPILAAGEALAKTADGKADQPFGGLAVAGGRVLVTVPLAAGPAVRVIEWATGNKIADWPVPFAGDVDTDAAGNAWVACGDEIVCVNPQGQIAKRLQPGVKTTYVAVGAKQIAAISAPASRIALLDLTDGRVARTLGSPHPMGQWLAPSGNLLRNLRDGAFMPDGQLLVCQGGRVRLLDPETGRETMVLHSNFMDALVPHPKNPGIVYCYTANIFSLDHKTGAWDLIRESPGSVDTDLGLGMCITAGFVEGKPHLLVYGNDSHELTPDEKTNRTYNARRFVLLDISDPLQPKYAGFMRSHHPMTYTDVRFDKDGNLCWPENSKLRVVVSKLLGRDERGLLRYSELGGYGKPSHPLEYRGLAEKDPTPRGMFHKGGLAFDPRNNDAYLMACTPLHNKMVPAWGASATGIGKLTADGRPLWFTLSSGGNYTSVSSVFDGKELWILAGKDFGGQVDLYTSDGLRVATGNWNWPSHWTCGFVDMREGVQAYLRPDGKPGAHVEDDNIGRFTRVRVEGADTLRRTVARVAWAGPGAAAGPAPVPHEVAGNTLRNIVKAPRVPEWPVDGDWARWAAAGVTPQIVSLPIVGWGRTAPQNLLQTFEAGTSIGAVAHDGKNVYVYFLTTDSTPNFHAAGAGNLMWEFDSIELWIEEEQIGLGFNNEGKAKLFKYRYHNREGKEWSANYALPDDSVWGVRLDSVASHPLGQLLGAAIGASLEGKAGYALMARIPMEEIKLVGGIAGRLGGQILPLTGAKGEVFRIGVAFDGVVAWGREQDFKIYWPIGLMYSDPTTNIPFELGE